MYAMSLPSHLTPKVPDSPISRLLYWKTTELCDCKLHDPRKLHQLVPHIGKLLNKAGKGLQCLLLDMEKHNRTVLYRGCDTFSDYSFPGILPIIRREIPKDN